MNLPSYAVVKEKALELGFQKVGYLPMSSLTIDEQPLKHWLSQGFHADMQWMADHLEKRLEPASLMPNTQSVLCFAMNYYPGEIHPGSQAKIARYAQGDDYHYVLKKQLKTLLGWLKTFDSKIEGRPLVDSAPILEKALAVKAGLGWQGKHSNLITRDLGSWVFLGELLLNITLPEAPQSEPVTDLCGRCQRCITACPTDAIVEPYVVDANRCISYWTIEHKGTSLPENIVSQMQGWLFGCDICQEVCPWNIKFQQITEESAFHPRPWNKKVNLKDLEQLTPAQFKVRYRRSPLKRTKLDGLKRNVAALTKSAFTVTSTHVQSHHGH